MNFEKTINSMAASVRYGFATNSSSSHSILLTQDTGAKNVLPDESGAYGWEWFRLADEDSKMDYLWTAIFGQLKGRLCSRYTGFNEYTEDFKTRTEHIDLPDLGEVVNSYIFKLTSAVLEYEPSFELNPQDQPYIDHQSCFSLPIDESSLLPHKGFTSWFKETLKKPGTIIYGGNDNDDSGSTGRSPGKNLLEASGLSRDEYSDTKFTCRERKDHFLLFNSENGWKTRVPKVVGADIPFTEYPELVDIKITDHCTMGCSYCYQGSTPSGKHANITPYELRGMLKAMQVVEVAIGGGEPLTHPKFHDLVYDLSTHGICVNVTTRRLDLLKPEMLKHIKQVGYSVETLKAAQHAVDHAERDPDRWYKKLTLHIVLGTMPKDQFLAVLDLAKTTYTPVLLLGYKVDGFGHLYTPHEHQDWIKWIEERFTGKRGWSGPSIGVDTAIVQHYMQELEDQLNIDQKYMVGEEGMFSMYMDLVDNTIARASYGYEKRPP